MTKQDTQTTNPENCVHLFVNEEGFLYCQNCLAIKEEAPADLPERFYCAECGCEAEDETCRACGNEADEVCGFCDELLDNCDCER